MRSTAMPWCMLVKKVWRVTGSVASEPMKATPTASVTMASTNTHVRAVRLPLRTPRARKAGTIVSRPSTISSIAPVWPRSSTGGSTPNSRLMSVSRATR